MVIHPNTKLTPKLRKALARDYFECGFKKRELKEKYGVSYPTVRKVLVRAARGDYTVHNSMNARYRCVVYGLRRLAQVEQRIQERLKRQALRYEKNYPGELFHMDTKVLPRLLGEQGMRTREYLFVGIDDYSRELYAAILPDASQHSSSAFLRQVLEECPYTLERLLTDNGKEYKGNQKLHLFMQTCDQAGIRQKFTRIRRPQTNGKAERVIRTLMDGWHKQMDFTTKAERHKALTRFVNYYNTVRPHSSLDRATPLERLLQYFYPTPGEGLTGVKQREDL